MKSNLVLEIAVPGDLVRVHPAWHLDYYGVVGLVGVVIEREERSRGRDYMNDPIYENGCWVSFPTAKGEFERSRWHWLEDRKIQIISQK